MTRLTALRSRTDRVLAQKGGDPVGFLRRLRSDRGQGVVEFAMILPFLGLVVIVCILFGKALYVYIQVTHAANEGARLAAVNQPTATALSSFLTNEFALPGGASVAICYPTGSRLVGEPVEIDVYTDASWVPIINIGQIKAAATMRIEQDTTSNTRLNATTTFDSTKKMCQT
jgi:Flp pilus assembly protein TadG